LKVDSDKQGRKHAASKQMFHNFLNGLLLGGNIALKCCWYFCWMWQGIWGILARALHQLYKFNLLHSCGCYICVVM